MNTTILVGCILVAAALVVMVLLVLWSRRTINRIARERLHSARDIVRELNNDR